MTITDRLLKVLRNTVVTVLVVLSIGLSYWYFKHKRRMRRLRQLAEQREIVKGWKARKFKAGPDDFVVLKNENPTSLQDEKNLKGRPLWVSAGGEMEYYPYNGHSVEFGHAAGILQGAQKIIVQDAVLQVAPKGGAFRIPQGDGQVLLIFTRPDDPKDPDKEYAVAVGDKEDSDFYILTDQVFYYDDPHKLYGYWGKSVWDAIDQHKAILGMNERQVQLALGQVSTPRGDIMGDRDVEFDDQGKQQLITFVNGKAIEIRDVGEVATP